MHLPATRLLPLLGFIAVLLTTPVAAQSTPAAPPAQPVARYNLPRQRNITFSITKPILGWPGEASPDYARCAPDGTTFLQVSADAAKLGAEGIPPGIREIYSISSTAEVKRISRTLPVDFDVVSVKDFFVGEHVLVTLLQASKSGDRDQAPRETTYFLSVSDHDGDASKLVPLDIKFRPLKIAVLHSGQYITLGWDEANQLPLLAVLKEDGTVRRFIDLDSHRPGQEHEQRFSTSLLEAASSKAASAALGPLERSAFVAYRGGVLLTFPFTTLPVRILSDIGEAGSVSLQLPTGFVLHDILVSGSDMTWGVRAQTRKASEDAATPQSAAKADAKVELRMFAINSYNGSRVTDYLFDKPPLPQVTCAASYKFTAIFKEPITDGTPGAIAPDHAPESAGEQWVVSTVPR